VRTVRSCAIGAVLGALLPVVIVVAGRACEERACRAELILDLLAMFAVLMPSTLVTWPRAVVERMCPVPQTSIAPFVAAASLVWAVVGAAIGALVAASVAASARPGKRSLRRLARAEAAKRDKDRAGNRLEAS
jgi:hypothetical protein